MQVDFKKIHEIRKQKKITVKGFCELCNIGRTTLWDWEHSNNTPNETKIRTIAKILNVSVTEFSDLPSDIDIPNDYNKVLKETVSDLLNLLYKENQSEEITLIKSQLTNVENQLASSSIIIKAIMNSLQSMLYIKDLKGNYLIANKAFLKNLSLMPEYRVIGKNDFDFLPNKEAKLNTEEDHEIITLKKEVIYKEDFIPGSRKKKWGIISKCPIISNKGKAIGLLAIISDITEKRKADRRRLILEEALDHIKDTCITIGKFSEKKPTEFTFDYMNDEMKELFNIKEDSDYSKIPEIWKEMLPEESKHIYQKRREVTEFPAHFTYKAIRPKDNKTVWLQDSVYKADERLIFIVRDITEEKMRLKDLAEFEFLFDSLPLAIEVLDYEKDKVVYSNNKIEEIFGHTKEEVADWNFWVENIVHPDDRDEQRKYEADNKYPENRYYRIIKSNGQTVTIKNTHTVKEYNEHKYIIITNCIA